MQATEGDARPKERTLPTAGGGLHSLYCNARGQKERRMKDTVLTGRVSRPRMEKRYSLGCVCIVGGGGPRWLEG